MSNSTNNNGKALLWIKSIITLSFIKSNNLKALFLKLTSVITSSLFVFVIDWGETKKSPFLFAAFDCFFALFTFFLIVKKWRPRLFSTKVLRVVFRPPQDSVYMNFKLLVPCIISNFAHYPLLSIATRYIDIIPAAIIYGMSPLFLVLLSSLLFRKEKRYKRLTLWVFILFAIGLTGFGFVTIGQLEEFSFVFEVNWTILWGGFIALGAALCSAMSSSFTIRHGVMTYQKIKEVGENIEEIYCVMISRIIQRSIAGMALLIIVFFLGEQFTTRILVSAMITGLFFVPLGGTTSRLANLLTNNLGINALGYTAPLFAILWLFLFRDPNYINLGFLIIGVTAIITANLLLNFEAEIRLGYKALILALWGCGTFVYFRQGVMFYDYFNLIEVAVVIFILVLSFRTDRLVRRTTNEENNTIELQQKIKQQIGGDNSSNTDDEKTKIYIVWISKKKKPQDSKKRSGVTKCIDT